MTVSWAYLSMSNSGSVSRLGATSIAARIAIAIELGSKSARKSPAAWKRGEQFGEDVDGPVAIPAERALGAGERRAHDLNDGAELIGVVADEFEIGLDVGAQHLRAGCLRFDAGLHVRPRLLEHLGDDLGDQVVFAGEVVADHALADAEPYRDTRERGFRVADLGDRVDRRLDDLRPPALVDKRAVGARRFGRMARN